MTDASQTEKDFSTKWNKFAYGAFIVVSLYFFFFNKDLSTAVANFGIALVFDPFNQQQAWSNRPIWQRGWLIIHLLVLFTGFGFLISGY